MAAVCVNSRYKGSNSNPYQIIKNRKPPIESWVLYFITLAPYLTKLISTNENNHKINSTAHQPSNIIMKTIIISSPFVGKILPIGPITLAPCVVAYL